MINDHNAHIATIRFSLKGQIISKKIMFLHKRRKIHQVRYRKIHRKDDDREMNMTTILESNSGNSINRKTGTNLSQNLLITNSTWLTKVGNLP